MKRACIAYKHMWVAAKCNPNVQAATREGKASTGRFEALGLVRHLSLRQRVCGYVGSADTANWNVSSAS